MATSNTIVSRTGTGWTVDVSASNLDSSTALKDFVVLHAGVVASIGDYTKTTSTVLTYNGSALGAGTLVEVRRSTPVAQYQALTGFPARLSSALWNKEIDRITRRAEEYALNGVGTNAVVTLALPKDDPFGVVWDSDTIYPPTRNAVYDYVSTLAPIANPTFTGDPKAPTPATSDSDTSIATTAFVKNVLAGGPAITNGTANTPTPGDNSTKIATTAFVANASGKSITILQQSSNTKIGFLNREKWTTATGVTEVVDTGSCYNGTLYTAPSAGLYLLEGWVSWTVTAWNSSTYQVFNAQMSKNGGAWNDLGLGNQVLSTANNWVFDPFIGAITLAAGDTLEFAAYNKNFDISNPNQLHGGFIKIQQL